MVKNIIENIQNVFESSIFENNTIKNVMLFGNKLSKNNRIYQEKAIQNIAQLAEGNKAFINHDAKKDGGVRDLRDWLGTFTNIRKAGNTVSGNLTVRESYLPLLKDISKLNPRGIGFSINAKAQVGFDEKRQMETVESIDVLRSVDLVSEAATTSNLFASAMLESYVINNGTIDEALEKFFGIETKNISQADVERFCKKLIGWRKDTFICNKVK